MKQLQRKIMAGIQAILTRWLAYTLILTAFIYLPGCSNELKPLIWDEEVKSPDGQTFTLKRYQEFNGPHEIGSPPSATNYKIEFTNPTTKQTIKWEQKSPPYLIPIAILLKSSDTYLVTMPGTGMAWEKYRCPNPIYLTFKNKKAGDWEQIPITDIPTKKIRANLTIDLDSIRSKSEPIHLTLSETENSFINGHPYILNFTNLTQQFNSPPCKWRDTSRDALEMGEAK